MTKFPIENLDWWLAVFKFGYVGVVDGIYGHLSHFLLDFDINRVRPIVDCRSEG